MPNNNPLHVTSNSTYGWNAKGVKVVLPEKHFEPKLAKFNKDFWRSSNAAYGNNNFTKRGLAKAVDELAAVAMTKRLPADDEDEKPAPVRLYERKYVESPLALKTYKHTAKSEHMIYTTSNNEIGKKTPNPLTDGASRTYSKQNDFTKNFGGVVYRNCGLNTTMTKPRFV